MCFSFSAATVVPARAGTAAVLVLVRSLILPRQLASSLPDTPFHSLVTSVHHQRHRQRKFIHATGEYLHLFRSLASFSLNQSLIPSPSLSPLSRSRRHSYQWPSYNTKSFSPSLASSFDFLFALASALPLSLFLFVPLDSLIQ